MVDLDAVVMAAGEGSRLRPLTERWPKPTLPIDGRPVIGTLLRELAEAGFERVTVVVGHLGNQIRELVGDGSGFGLRTEYAEQPEPLGSADAVQHALETGVRPPLLVAAADTVFASGAIGSAASTWLASGTVAGIAVREAPSQELSARSPVRVENGRVAELGSDVAGGPSRLGDRLSLAAAPLWFLGEQVIARLESLPGPPFELAEALRATVAAGEAVAALEVGPTRDLTRPADIVARNFPYLG
jgi:NDP-sugar pyrophosphorylase family protein